MINIDQKAQDLIDENNRYRPLTQDERDSISRMVGMGAIVADSVPTPQGHVHLTDEQVAMIEGGDGAFKMLAISIIATVSFILGVAVGVIGWVVT